MRKAQRKVNHKPTRAQLEARDIQRKRMSRQRKLHDQKKAAKSLTKLAGERILPSERGRLRKSQLERDTDRKARELEKRREAREAIEQAQENRILGNCKHGKWRTIARMGTGNDGTAVQTCGNGCGETRTVRETSVRW